MGNKGGREESANTAEATQTQIPRTDAPRLVSPIKDKRGGLQSTVIESSKCLPSESVLVQMRSKLPLAMQMHDDWFLLYDSEQHGLSMRVWTEKVFNHGPALLIIRDRNGNRFGCFASVQWDRCSTWFGDSKCFLFEIVNKEEEEEKEEEEIGGGDDVCGGEEDVKEEKYVVKVYRPHGRNTNFLYCNYGPGSDFNGIAAGGQMGHFSLSINDDFMTGTSRPGLLTYGRPPSLCRHGNEGKPEDPDYDPEVFQVDSIECYAFPLTESQRLDLEFRQNQRLARNERALESDSDMFILQTSGIMSGEGTNMRRADADAEEKSDSHDK